MRICCDVFRAVAADGRSCQPEWMITKKNLLKQAGRFAAALEGPLGPRPMQRVVEQFLDFFIDLRRSGATWPQIANLLFAAGVRTRCGKPLSDPVLRAIVSRATRRKKVQSTGSVAARAEKPGAGSLILPPASAGDTPSFASRAVQPSAGQADVAARIRRAAVMRGERSGDGGRHG